jgi:hypothetical protein
LKHPSDYVKTLDRAVKDGEMSDKHRSERRRVLKTALVGLKGETAKTEKERDKVLEGMTLTDITSVALSQFLKELGTSARTRDTYRGAATTFCNWLVSVDGGKRLEYTPCTRSPSRRAERFGSGGR